MGKMCGVEETAEETARLLAAFQIETNEQLFALILKALLMAANVVQIGQKVYIKRFIL